MLEITGRQRVHAVIVCACIEHERQQHCVVDRRDVDADIGEDGQVVFDVLANFEDGVVFKDGFESGDGIFELDLLGGGGFEHVPCPVGIDMGERDIAGFIRGCGQRDTNKLCGDRIKTICFGVYGEDASVAGAFDPVVKTGKRGDGFIG